MLEVKVVGKSLRGCIHYRQCMHCMQRKIMSVIPACVVCTQDYDFMFTFLIQHG
ncbi:hypothetical protein H206_05514 [Candidatus Electrothrix aarhusensis]|uniref:Uncharacterized protein n=1 Tax=Candidatus Electrothrix aarhusensis TaxID=1859131 RepID=A0A444J476_9BACT|nr:hypothetical protein H206_05514 [Candidatus Electrothrix aarhusensis]